MKIEKDLIGVPKAIIERMKDYQAEQGNRRNAKVFDDNITCNFENGGFNWEKTREGFNFWNMIICFKKYDLFFKKYPEVTASKPSERYKAKMSKTKDVLDKIVIEGEIKKKKSKKTDNTCLMKIEDKHPLPELKPKDIEDLRDY